jgi:RNA polymerase sigma-70 factor (ECF subfamily)
VRLCLHCCHTRLRRRRPAEAALDEVGEPAAAHDPDARLEVERLLARLRPADRMVLLLLDAEGWSVAEIAARTGWSRVNVKVRAHRARRRLRRFLERVELGGEPQ